MDILELIKLIVPGLVAAVGTLGAHYFLEIRRHKLARQIKVDERRLDAWQKLASALTKLDLAVSALEDAFLERKDETNASERIAPAYSETLAAIADASFFFSDVQREAVHAFLREWDMSMEEGKTPVEIPSPSRLLKDHFGPEMALKLPMTPPAAVRKGLLGQRPTKS